MSECGEKSARLKITNRKRIIFLLSLVDSFLRFGIFCLLFIFSFFVFLILFFVFIGGKNLFNTHSTRQALACNAQLNEAAVKNSN